MKLNRLLKKEFQNEPKELQRRTSNQKAMLYYLIAIYIGFMGYSILRNRFTGDDTMSYPLALVLALVFVIGAVGIICYATSLIRKERKRDEVKSDL